MERIIRIGVVFAVITAACLLAIVIANGELTWATAGLVLVVALVAGLAAGTWAIVHGQFPRSTEIGLTVGIVVAFMLIFMLLLMGGAEIKQAFRDVFADGSGWWLVAPVVATAALTFLLELHRPRRTGRR